MGCGGLRDPEYAKTHPCVCCNSYGTRDTMPKFDEFGEPIEEVEQPKVEPKPKVKVERPAKVQPTAKVERPKKESKPAAEHVQPVKQQKQVAATSLDDLFLMVM